MSASPRRERLVDPILALLVTAQTAVRDQLKVLDRTVIVIARQDADVRKVYEMVVAEKMLMQGFHYPFPALGHVEKDGSGYRVVPMHWTPKI